MDAATRRISLAHLGAAAVPLALAELHRELPVGAPVELTLPGDPPEDDLHTRDVVVGAGFDLDELGPIVRARRARTLPDTVGPGMALLVCGLNPSLRAADAGIGYVTPGNRFWPAALAAGLVARDRDPWHALRAHGIGLTDLVKRASPRADVLTAAEYRDGLARVERLCAWLRPRGVCFVGLAGWRAAVDRRAQAGPQARTLGGVPVYVLPSTSGANAATPLAVLVEHLRAALVRST